VAGRLDAAALAAGLARMSVRMEEVVDELNALDGRLGDGDLGVTLVRGFRAVAEAMPELPQDDLGRALMTVAQAFTRSSGSSFGTLTATGLMAAGRRARGREALDWAEVPGLLRAAGEAMAARGKADLGQKTVLDALDAAAGAAEGHTAPGPMLAAAREAVGDTMNRLRDAPAQVGRARIFADRSRGLDDPGMVAFAHMLDALGEEQTP